MKVAILGYGNIGRAAEEAIKAAPDMELAGIYHHDDCLSCIAGNIDVMLVCTPTREVQKFATVLAARGICTVDSFDIHGQIWNLRESLDAVYSSPDGLYRVGGWSGFQDR